MKVWLYDGPNQTLKWSIIKGSPLYEIQCRFGVFLCLYMVPALKCKII